MGCDPSPRNASIHAGTLLGFGSLYMDGRKCAKQSAQYNVRRTNMLMIAQNYARCHASCGPTFHTVKSLDNPSRKIQDLGVDMCWGTPRHTARLYRNLTDHAPAAFNFEHVVIHEEDCPEDFEYQPCLARKTAVGMFYPLTAYMLHLYRSQQAGRNIFSVLAELDRLLPEDRWVTQEDIRQFCLSCGNIKPLAEGTQSEPPVNILAKDLEDQGYRVEFHTVEDSRCLLDIGWQPKPKARIFFTGILEYLAENQKSGAGGGCQDCSASRKSGRRLS